MTGQMYLSAAVTQIAGALLILAVFSLTDWGPALSIAICAPLMAAFAFWSLPRFMALWVAVEWMTDIANREPWTRE